MTNDDTVLCVRDPKTEYSENGEKYTHYEIYVRTTSMMFNESESSGVRRRFSEFDWLRKKLVSADIRNVPPLPPKSWFGRFDEDFIEIRRAALQKFLRALLDLPGVLSEKSFHLFVQTKHSVMDMSRELYEPGSPSRNYPDCTLSPAIIVVKPDRPLVQRAESHRSSPESCGGQSAESPGAFGDSSPEFVTYNSQPGTVEQSPIGSYSSRATTPGYSRPASTSHAPAQ